MKLTMDQVEAKLTAAWGAQAHVIPYRVSGNRYVYVATDHNGHRMPLDKSWTGGHLLLEPTVGTWPWLKPDPWPDAVLDAAQLALVYFTNLGDKEAVKRLPRAQVIAEGRNWRRVGDKFDTWLMPSCSKLGLVYMVNGRCTCPDPVRWCKHRLGRALAKRAVLEHCAGIRGSFSTFDTIGTLPWYNGDSGEATAIAKHPDQGSDRANGLARRAKRHGPFGWNERFSVWRWLL